MDYNHIIIYLEGKTSSIFSEYCTILQNIISFIVFFCRLQFIEVIV